MITGLAFAVVLLVAVLLADRQVSKVLQARLPAKATSPEFEALRAELAAVRQVAVKASEVAMNASMSNGFRGG